MPLDPNAALERRLRAAVESSPSGLVMIDSEGRIVLVNREVERLFGYPREELLGRSIDILVPPRFRGPHVDFRQAYLADPKIRRMGAGRELFGLTKSGQEVPVEIGLTPVATEEGMFVLSSIVDLSARKRADERFRVAVEASPNGVVMIDERGTIVLINREVERMFGYPREELLGQSIETLVPARAREQHPRFRNEFFRDPQTRGMGMGRELFGLTKQGQEIPVEIGLNPIETEEGLFVLGSIVDISARKESEASRRSLEEELRQSQKMEAIGTLAGGIAHDFNNLLGAIVSYGELIDETLTDEQARADMRELLGAADRGRQLVEHILSFSRRQDVERRPLALGQVVGAATKLLRATLPASVAIRLHVHPSLPRVLADATSIHQVVLNLGTNAAHAMPNGGTLSISLEPTYVRDSMARGRSDLHEGPYALMVVTDTGSGMDRVTKSRVFEPFFTTKPQGAGTGLGLSVVHGIMRAHTGAVDLESEPGAGTSVRCYFPGIVSEREDEERVPQAARPGQGQRILMVEDEPALASAGARRLAKLGYQVTAESDSRRALETIRAQPDAYDLLITDFSMPHLDGVGLAREVTKVAPDLPIMMVSGYVEGRTEQEISEAGIRLLLAKPATIDQLGTAVQQLLQGSRSA
jgi:PAS domain S-box-containing protein